MTGKILLCCADPREGEIVRASGRPDVVELGVGKAAAAARLARVLATDREIGCVLLFGICGAYPVPERPPALQVLDLCVVTESVFADEGAATDDGFSDLVAMGLQQVAAWSADPGRSHVLAERLGLPAVRAATVSTCSGTAELSDAFAARSGAQVETMESAACALACAAAHVPLVELRCVSNRTGPRAEGGFRIREAAARAQEAVLRILDEGWLR